MSSPLALAVVPALLANFTDATLPIWLDPPISLFAAALIPVILLTLGVQLAGMPRALPAPGLAIPIALKLLLAPAVAVAAIGLLDLDGLAGDVIVFQAAMPAAVFTSLIAIKHDLEADYVTSVVLVGTLVSALTLPVVVTFSERSRCSRKVRARAMPLFDMVHDGPRRVVACHEGAT
ncbi:MAG: AEC family transporter [Actinomycetota bacterium]